MAAYDRRTCDIDLLGLQRPFVLLEDRLTPATPARLYRDPKAVLRCDDPGQLEAVLIEVEAGLTRGLHVAGFLAYDLGYALEPRLSALMPSRRDQPLIWLGLFEAPWEIPSEDMDRAFAALGPPPPIQQVRGARDQAGHMRLVRQCLDLIAAGDVYQVNLTFPLRFRYEGDRLALYGALRARQPVAHGGVAVLDELAVLSVSPELWIDVKGAVATARPMKGTVGRGGDPSSDRLAARGLAADPKQRAENLMIVDLLRNDLARISEPGSVQVRDLFTVETYPSLHTLTSTVTARPRQGVSLGERLAALFPCGSVVGAPKIRAAEIIRDLEDGARGVYTGALGAIEPSGDMAFNVAIRTAVIAADGVGHYGVGGGIVADSDPGAEYEEALLKARVLDDLGRDFDLIETFRWSRGEGFVRLDLHLDRLSVSAAKLGFVLDLPELERRLAEHVQAMAGEARRVRVLLARDGGVTIKSEILVERRRPLKVCLADARLDPGDPFLGHKTTRRETYDNAFEAAIASGFDECLFLNRNGELAEASRNTFFLERNARLLTPPLECGVLPGVLRRLMIERGEAVEARLRLDDLRQASSWFLGNSLHGLREARLVETPVVQA